MYPRGISQISNVLQGEPQGPRDDFAVVRHHFPVTRAVQFTRLGSPGERLNGLAQHHEVAAFIIAAHFTQSSEQLFQMLRTGVLTLQETFDVTRNELPLHRRSFAFRKFFRSRDAVAARVFRNVHACIRHTDDVLD